MSLRTVLTAFQELLLGIPQIILEKQLKTSEALPLSSYKRLKVLLLNQVNRKKDDSVSDYRVD
jgi:hypothetical protein